MLKHDLFDLFYANDEPIKLLKMDIKEMQTNLLRAIQDKTLNRDQSREMSEQLGSIERALMDRLVISFALPGDVYDDSEIDHDLNDELFMKDCYMIVSLIAVIDVSAHAVAASLCVHNGIVRGFRWLSNSRLRWIHGVYGVALVSPLVIEENGAFPFKTHLTMETEIDMQKFTAKIVDMMKQEKLYASQGGPIILSQLWHLRRLGYGIELKSTIRNWGKLTDWLNVADFNGVAVVQNYLDRMGREEWAKQVITFLAISI
ncbi:hypothetical protein Syun_012514 [Stephania yunnanensis]|uniref:WDR11 second beta-propeller domain-containing protein n=1 Tax=Stephania yunnanensis TaxID=152371 RepID=A0AAP0K0C9_9MAGN